MNIKHVIPLYLAAVVPTLHAAETPPAAQLPAPQEFELTRYLGTWFEVARLPAPYQGDDTLASAEYALADTPGVVSVKNTAYDANGAVSGVMEGRAPRCICGWQGSESLPQMVPRELVKLGFFGRNNHNKPRGGIMG